MRSTKVKEKKAKTKAEELLENQVEPGSAQLAKKPSANAEKDASENTANTDESGGEGKSVNEEYYNALFEGWDEAEFVPQDFMSRVPIDSIESRIGYSSLFRQMHNSFIRMVVYYQTPAGGSLSVHEARKQAFHACKNKEEVKKRFSTLMQSPLESLDFVDLMELQNEAPRVAERFWERAKREGRAEFESGHLAANITFPAGYMKQVWNIARFMGLRESFIAEWKPKRRH
jgi:hypothetical protein